MLPCVTPDRYHHKTEPRREDGSAGSSPSTAEIACFAEGRRSWSTTGLDSVFQFVSHDHPAASAPATHLSRRSLPFHLTSARGDRLYCFAMRMRRTSARWA